MRPILLLILTISVTLLGTSTWAETPKEKWEGYKPVAETELPAQVKAFAENSVFLLESVDAAPGQEMEVIDLENDPRAKSITKDKRTLTGDVVPFQIETCRKQKLRFCPIATKKYSGTMFFNNGKFYTCRHNFHNWITVAAEANNLSVDKITPPMILRIPNKEKPGKFKVVYQSSFSEDPLLRFSTINTSEKLNVKYDDPKADTTKNNEIVAKADFVEMIAPSGKSSLIKDSKLEIENISAGSKSTEIYTFGYPGKTSMTSLGQGNAAGNQLTVTNGHVLGFESESNMFVSSNFGSLGMSGGPAVTSSGKLVGMVCSGFNDISQSGSVSLQKKSSSPYSGFFSINKGQQYDFWQTLELAQGTTKSEVTSVLN